MRTTFTALAGAAAMLLGASSTASAATAGHVAANPVNCGGGNDFVGAAGAFTAPGHVSSFSFRGLGSGARGDLQVLRPTANPNEFTVLYSSRVTDSGVSGAVVTVPTSVDVQAGDTLALYSVDYGFPCLEQVSGEATQYDYIPEPATGDTVSLPQPGYNYGSNLAADVTGQAVDSTAPSCGALVVQPGAGQASISPSDAGSGLKSITNLKISNGTGTVGPFSPGAPSTTITVTKSNPALRTVFNFDVTDVAGNVTHCA